MKAIETTTAAVPTDEPVTNEARVWALIKEAAELGFRLKVANELDGMNIDRRLDRSVEEREQRLADYRRAETINRDWQPLAGEVPPRRK